MSESSIGDRFTTESLKALLGESRSGFDPWVQFTDGRVGILFCALCADLECGAVSADIRLNSTTVEWHDLGFQTEDPELGVSGLLPGFSLTFDRNQYESTVRTLLGEWSR